ncbi:MAG: thermonuclease family protein [Phycisphaerae bacterium]|nr:thermonuclease family protein [Phycisphaerae bacterium]
MKNKKIKYAQSRLQKKILLLSALLLLSAVVWFDKTFHPYLKTPLSTQKTQDVNDWDKYNEKSFIVVKVVDGDTIDINIPDATYATTRIRLLGVDTPETKNPHTKVMYFGPEASKFTTDTVLGQIVFVIMDKKSKPRDKYHRLLCHIRLADGRILNEELISQGFGYADTRFPHSFYEKYI